MYIRKKTFILIITYLAAAVVALGAYTAVHFGMEGSYRRTAEYGYHSADKAAKCNACRRNKYISHIIPPIAVDAFYAALEKL